MPGWQQEIGHGPENVKVPSWQQEIGHNPERKGRGCPKDLHQVKGMPEGLTPGDARRTYTKGMPEGLTPKGCPKDLHQRDARRTYTKGKGMPEGLTPSCYSARYSS